MKTRIGVFVCHCGNNIGAVVDIPQVMEFCRNLQNVVHVEDNMYSCSEDSLSSMIRSIQENKLNRVVVAACTPRTHEPLFKNCCEEAGLNKYLFEFVNIREHCSWIHSQKKQEATTKACSLIRMGVAKVRLKDPRNDIEVDICPKSLVIGGGIAGIISALNLANQGFEVHVIEKTDHLGGLTFDLTNMFPDSEAKDKLFQLIKRVKGNSNIKLHLNTTVKECSGNLGNFSVSITEQGGEAELHVGTIIIATGAGEYKPFNSYGYGAFPNVVTQMEFEGLFDKRVEQYKNIIMINCVGAREPDCMYCSQICCITSIKNALMVKKVNPESRVYILHRDVMAYGIFEKYYREAMERGIKFIRYNIDNIPKMIGNGKVENVSVYDELIGKQLHLPSDVVVLSTPLAAHTDNTTISKIFKVPLSDEKFFLEAHQKLRPVEFSNDGIFVCGSARWPVDASESISQGYAAASKAAIPMRKKRVQFEALNAFCDENICSGCGSCIQVCPFDAVDFKELDNGKKAAEVNVVQCKGCGCCVAACKNGAMQQNGFTDYQLVSMINNLT